MNLQSLSILCCEMIEKISKVVKPPLVSRLLKSSQAGNAGVITLNRGDALNTINYVMTA